MPKKATKRRQLLEKHTPGWTPEDASQPEEGQSSPKPELAEKGKEKPAKKASRTKETVDKGSVVQKPIKFKVWRPEQELVDFVQKIRLVTTDEEAEEEPTETLIRRSKKLDRKQRAEEKAPTVVVETHEQEEHRGTNTVRHQSANRNQARNESLHRV